MKLNKPESNSEIDGHFRDYFSNEIENTTTAYPANQIHRSAGYSNHRKIKNMLVDFGFTAALVLVTGLCLILSSVESPIERKLAQYYRTNKIDQKIYDKFDRIHEIMKHLKQ